MPSPACLRCCEARHACRLTSDQHRQQAASAGMEGCEGFASTAGVHTHCNQPPCTCTRLPCLPRCRPRSSGGTAGGGEVNRGTEWVQGLPSTQAACLRTQLKQRVYALNSRRHLPCAPPMAPPMGTCPTAPHGASCPTIVHASLPALRRAVQQRCALPPSSPHPQTESGMHHKEAQQAARCGC